MSITVACPSCSKRFALPESTAGKTGRCKSCGQVFKIPTLAPKDSRGATAQAFGPGAGPTPKAPDHDLDALRHQQIPGLDDDDDEAEEEVRYQSTAQPDLERLRYEAFDEEEEVEEESYLVADESHALVAPNLPPQRTKSGKDWSEPATAVSKKKATRKKSGGLGAFEFGSLPIVIFFGGSALLWLFLFAVVWPSMQGREGGAVAGVPVPNEVLRNLPPEMQQALRNAPKAGNDGFPQLPPPDPNLYPAGQQPSVPKSGPIREDVVAQHERAMDEVLGSFDQFRNVFDSIQDAASVQSLEGRLREISQQCQQAIDRARTLVTLSADEERAFKARVEGKARASLERLRQSANRLPTVPGLGLVGARLTQGANLMATGLEQSLAQAGNTTVVYNPHPYVDVFVEGVPDGDVSEMLREKLETITDDPKGGSAGAMWIGGTKGASYRVVPVADPSSFAKRIDFGSPIVTGHKIMVTRLNVDNDALVAYKQRRGTPQATADQHVEASASTARPDDPKPPPDADSITKSLYKVRSSDGFRQREGLEELERVVPDDARREEVVKAVIPLATGTDHFSAIAAARTLSNWPNDEAIAVLVHVVKQNSDHFIRAEAIKTLGKLKAGQAADAIAAHLSENEGEASKALRSIGAPAETALIELLTDPEANQRRAACELLTDLGRIAAFEAMSKLPADSDVLVQEKARAAMLAIAARIGPDEVRRIQSESRKKR